MEMPCLLESVLNYWQATCREQRWKLKHKFLLSLKKNNDISVSTCGERTDTLFWSLYEEANLAYQISEHSIVSVMTKLSLIHGGILEENSHLRHEEIIISCMTI